MWNSQSSIVSEVLQRVTDLSSLVAPLQEPQDTEFAKPLAPSTDVNCQQTTSPQRKAVDFSKVFA